MHVTSSDDSPPSSTSTGCRAISWLGRKLKGGGLNATNPSGRRHIDLNYLWLQDKVSRKIVTGTKMRGNKNPSDIGTKHVDKETLARAQ